MNKPRNYFTKDEVERLRNIAIKIEFHHCRKCKRQRATRIIQSNGLLAKICLACNQEWVKKKGV